MNYYAFIINGKIDGKGQCPCSAEGLICVEITEETYNNIERYIWNGESVILNPNYEQEQLIKQKQARIQEIKEKLDELDLKSIRAIRAGETDRVLSIETEAQNYRNEINTLSLDIDLLKKDINNDNN
ncbi:MAG: hypothetical protein IIY81_13525 [Lachnospiraceae bacterium]|nr:hypothetical protein [Lachnospiraceae bacterium]